MARPSRLLTKLNLIHMLGLFFRVFEIEPL
jgi:hypothetical protein